MVRLPKYLDERGNLVVLDDVESLLPFKIKRVFYIFDVDDSLRGGHRHKQTVQAAICLKGVCEVSCDDGTHKENYVLNSADKCLVLLTKDWHVMHHFSNDALLLVFASTKFDYNDYIFVPYS